MYFVYRVGIFIVLKCNNADLLYKKRFLTIFTNQTVSACTHDGLNVQFKSSLLCTEFSAAVYVTTVV